MYADRGVCLCAPRYRRKITARVAQLVLESDGYRRPDITQAERPCGSWLVGLGALLHSGEQVTWPALESLIVPLIYLHVHIYTSEERESVSTAVFPLFYNTSTENLDGSLE